jgi:hypothetical protein
LGFDLCRAALCAETFFTLRRHWAADREMLRAVNETCAFGSVDDLGRALPHA